VIAVGVIVALVVAGLAVVLIRSAGKPGLRRERPDRAPRSPQGDEDQAYFNSLREVPPTEDPAPPRNSAGRH
jgi:hypothetical protein